MTCKNHFTDLFPPSVIRISLHIIRRIVSRRDSIHLINNRITLKIIDSNLIWFGLVPTFERDFKSSYSLDRLT